MKFDPFILGYLAGPVIAVALIGICQWIGNTLDRWRNG